MRFGGKLIQASVLATAVSALPFAFNACSDSELKALGVTDPSLPSPDVGPTEVVDAGDRGEAAPVVEEKNAATHSIAASLISAQWRYRPEAVLRKGPPGKWDSHSAYNPRVVLTVEGELYQDEAGYYYMYYTASDGSDNTDYDATGLAISRDLENWEKVSVDAPVLPRGAAGYIDAGDASAVSVLHDGQLFHMWHEANATPPGVATGDYVRIAYATSVDGRVWVKHGWVLQPGSSNYDALDVYAPAVVKDGPLWKMWFTGHDEAGRFGIMHATAPAPAGPWTRASTAFVFHPADDTFPSQVWKEQDTLYMTYSATPAGSPGSMWLAKMINGAWITVKNLSERRPNGWDAGEPGSWPSIAGKDGLVYLFYGANVYYQGGIGYKTTPLLERR